MISDKNILLNGIVCDYLKNEKPMLKYNGQFYISVSKNFRLDDNINSAYNYYIKMFPMFILSDKLHVVNTKKEDLLNKLCINTPFPFRTSPYIDEYQVFLRVKKEYILGIEYMVKNLIKLNTPGVIENLKELVKLLETLNLDMPIIDYSENKEINKEKVLKL